MSQTVLITGASGKVGRHAARCFANAGWHVRRFERGTDMVSAAKGADIIVNGMNPANYNNWSKTIPAITEAHISAARANGSAVIIPGNVYNFGAHCDGLWDEETAQLPTTRKGRIRKEMEARYAESGVQTIVLRAGNFIDPDATDDILSLLHLSRLAKGVVMTPGATHVRQAWCYMPDWAEAACDLAEMRSDLPKFSDIPFAGQTFSIDTLVATLEQQLERKLRIAAFPWWAMRLASPFWKLAWEMQEMRYLWDLDHGLSDRRLSELLPDFTPTPVAEVITRAGDNALAQQQKRRRPSEQQQGRSRPDGDGSLA